MFIIILLEVRRKFNFTIDIYNLDEFIKTLKFQLYKNQVLEQNEEDKRLLEFSELIKKKQEIEQNQISKNLEDEKGNIVYKVKEHAEGTGTRESAIRVKNEIFNILQTKPQIIILDF